MTEEKIYYLWSEDICIIDNLIYQADNWTKEDKDRVHNIFSSIYSDLFNSKDLFKVVLQDKEHESQISKL